MNIYARISFSLFLKNQLMIIQGSFSKKIHCILLFEVNGQEVMAQNGPEWTGMNGKIPLFDALKELKDIWHPPMAVQTVNRHSTDCCTILVLHF